MKKLPVLMIVFNRPETTEKVFAAVREYAPEKLYVSADGPRLILNPGSLSRPRGGSVESCALVLLEGKDMTVRFVNADNEPLTR